ncbi:hypothetical protein CALVIDRAFT_538001 [Calocera viscosa TUFC12733]|uniref:Uncharacterized protein n=1 Tax=Calocera viscosa (strain TUFC12733) TaxID=1330018 RepID=A0A167LEM3_CALVF|nr:hypothetical protein CALVIDRAFT_538001 [Calocera viscosa TUFC12733]
MYVLPFRSLQFPSYPGKKKRPHSLAPLAQPRLRGTLRIFQRQRLSFGDAVTFERAYCIRPGRLLLFALLGDPVQ